MISAIAFTSKIKIVDSNCFKKEVDKIKSQEKKGLVGYDTSECYSINDSKTSQELFTSGIVTCTAGGITNSRDIFMFHLAPRKAYLHDISKNKESKIISKISNEKDKMSQACSNLRALLVGGYIKVDDKELSTELTIGSFKLFHSILTLLSKGLKLKTSIIWGQRFKKEERGEMKACYSAQNDTWLVNINYKQNGNNTDITSLEKLKEHIEHVFICEGDELWIGNKEVKKEENPELFQND